MFSNHYPAVAQVHSSLFLGKVRVGGIFCGIKASVSPGNKWQLVGGTVLGGSEVPVRTPQMKVGKPSSSLRSTDVQFLYLFPVPILGFTELGEKKGCARCY